MAGNFGGRRQLTGDFGQRRIDKLERLKHVDLPVEEQINLRGPAAGDGTDGFQPLHAVDRLLYRTRDRDHHLIDGHHAVVNADHDARKIRGRKNRNRNIECLISSDQRNHNNEKDHGAGVVREPLAPRRHGFLASMIRDLGFIRHLA